MSPIPLGDEDFDSNVSESTGDEPYSLPRSRQVHRATSRGRSVSIPREAASAAQGEQAAGAAPVPGPRAPVLPTPVDPRNRQPLARKKATSLPPRTVQFAPEAEEVLLPIVPEEPMPLLITTTHVVPPESLAASAPAESSEQSEVVDVEMPQVPMTTSREPSRDVPAVQVQAASAATLANTSGSSGSSVDVTMVHAERTHHEGHVPATQHALWNSWQTSWRPSSTQQWWSQHTFQASTDWWQRDDRHPDPQSHSWWESSHRSQAASAATWRSHQERQGEYAPRSHAASAARSHSRGRRSGSRRRDAASAARSLSRSRQQRRGASREPPHVDRMMP
eukprot:6330458-Amphidinium_carterae.3